MATWEDGPEYAPLERPADFSSPAATPLEGVVTEPQPAAAAPEDRPAFDLPPAPVVDLALLAPIRNDERDPAVPFAVVSSTVTSMDSAWGAAHWSSPGAAGPVAAPSWPVPGGTPAAIATTGPAGAWPVPGATAPFPPGPVEPVGAFPPPGTPAWFGPGPAQVPQPLPTPVRTDARSVLAAATPGLCICLVIGGLLSPVAPAMMVVAYFLGTRVSVAQRQVRRAVGWGLGVLAFLSVLELLGNGAADSLWWEAVGGWARLICWVLLLTVVLQVWSALKRRVGSPPPRAGSPWR